MNKTRFIQLLFALGLFFSLFSSAFGQSINFNVTQATLNGADAANERPKCPGDNNAKARFLITSGGNNGPFTWELGNADGSSVGGVWVPAVTKTLNVTIQAATGPESSIWPQTTTQLPSPTGTAAPALLLPRSASIPFSNPPPLP